MSSEQTIESKRKVEERGSGGGGGGEEVEKEGGKKKKTGLKAREIGRKRNSFVIIETKKK